MHKRVWAMCEVRHSTSGTLGSCSSSAESLDCYSEPGRAAGGSAYLQRPPLCLLSPPVKPEIWGAHHLAASTSREREPETSLT